MYRIWKNFEACDRKNLDCLEETIGRNMDIKGTPAKASEGSEKDSRGSLYHLTEHVYHHEQNINRNMTIKSASTVRFQMKIRNMLLETGGKTTRVI